MPSDGFLPYGQQSINDDDLAAVAAALRSPYLTTGPLVERFEAAFANAVGAPEAVVCANGTAALHLAVAALNLAPMDAVIVPSVTFLATANVVRLCGAEIAFADVDQDTGLIRVEDAVAAYDRARAAGLVPRAIMPVHLAGQPVDMLAIHEFAERRGLTVVEDACHAVGTVYGEGQTPVGACQHSDMAAFSFHPVKTLTTMEGGAVTLRDRQLAKRLRALRSHGMVRDPADFSDKAAAFDDQGQVNPWYYEMPSIGFNYRLTDVQCALGLTQLARLNDFVARRRKLASMYDAEFSGVNIALQPPKRVPDADPAWHIYAVRIDFSALGKARGVVMRYLKGLGVGTQVHYHPVHQQPYYRQRYANLVLPGADRYAAATLSLPLFPDMNDVDVVRSFAALRSALNI